MEEHAIEHSEKPEASRPGQQGGRFYDALMREAYDKMREGQLREAAQIYEDVVIRFVPTLPVEEKGFVYGELARVYHALGNYEGAARHAERAGSYSDNHDQANIILGKIAVSRFHFSQARDCFSRVAASNPGRSLGMCLIELKLRHVGAAESYLGQAASAADFSSADIEYQILSAYVRLLRGQTEVAVAAARELLKSAHRNVPQLLLIAEIFMMSGNYGQAQAACNEAGRYAPDNDHMFAVKAHAEFAEENYDQARAYAQQAVALNLDNAYAQTVLMKLATRDGQYDQAERIAFRILSSSPEYSLVFANLGDVYFMQGRYDLAQAEYDQTEEMMDSKTKGARLRQSRMKFIAGEYGQAVSILEQLVGEMHGTYYDDAMCDLVLCYDKLGDEDKRGQILEKMELRKAFYFRTEKLLQQFAEEV